MKVKIEMTVEVDVERWANEYGVESRDVREDVKSYVCHWAENTPIPLKIISSNQGYRQQA